MKTECSIYIEIELGKRRKKKLVVVTTENNPTTNYATI
jgi:hypothetical protein